MAKGIKKIIITQEVKKNKEVITTFTIDGFSDFEVMGLLSYYNDAFKVDCMRKSDKDNSLKQKKT